MKLFTQEQLAQLKANGSPENAEKDHFPVVKWFTPDAGASWLVTELVDEDTVFGLCDLGLGFPELGYISISEIQSVRGLLGLPVERDLSFVGKYPLSVYNKLARLNDAIVTMDHLLEEFVKGAKIEE